MHRIDGPGATLENRFTEGNPASAIPATTVTADWLNALQEEIASLPEAVGIALGKADNKQLLSAIALHVGSIAVLRALPVPQLAADRSIVLYVRGYYADGDGGGGPFYWAAGSSEADNGVTVFAPSSVPANGRWKRFVGDYVTPQMAGAVLDGAVLDTTALQACCGVGVPVVVDRGVLLFDSITTTGRVHITVRKLATLKLAAPAVANSIGITISHAGSRIDCLGTFDGNSTGRSLVSLAADDCEAYLHDARNVTSGAASTSFTSGIEVTGSRCKFAIYGRTFTNAGNPNQSVPRLVTVQGGAQEYEGISVVGKDVVCGFLNGAGVGAGEIGLVHVINAADNGVYNLGGGLLKIDRVVYRGSEEPVVSQGTLEIGELVIHGPASTGLSIDNAQDIRIDRISIHANGAGESARSVFRARVGNVVSGRVSIGAVVGRVRGDALARIVDGTVDFLTVQNVDLEYVYDPLVSGSLGSWADLSGVKGFDFRAWRIKVIDTTSALTSANQFSIVAPTANLAHVSVWDDIDVELVKNDRVTKSDAVFRGFNLAQSLVYVSGALWQTNIGPYVRERNYLGGQRDSANQAPMVGTWRSGTDLALGGAAAAPFRTRCAVAGTPGTWVSY